MLDQPLISRPQGAAPTEHPNKAPLVVNGAAPPALSGDGPPLAAAGLPPAEPFPLDALTRPMADWVPASARALPCPVDLVAVPALGAVATTIGNTRQLRVKSNW